MKKQNETQSQEYVCPKCGYIYDPKVGDTENGIEAGTAFSDLPKDWVCPPCGLPAWQFVPVDEYYS